jgi:NADPH-dependent 2,4-dienoyl-CoA reductase/sulfur reductase-like enzyme
MILNNNLGHTHTDNKKERGIRGDSSPLTQAFEGLNMTVEDVDVVVIGGGPAGLAAALGARDEGAARVVVLERNAELGGILPQCIHNGFGLERFKSDLTGPEYAQRYIEMINESGIDIRLESMVLALKKDRRVTVVSPQQGLYELKARAVVLATGCRERTRGAVAIPGSRPAGIFTAGTAQRFINIHGYMPGNKAVILGSGDVGLIMARRLALEGASVHAVLEIRPYLTGLMRNKIQCLDDFGIPLKLSTTITQIHGRDRLEALTAAKVDENGQVIKGSEERLECDTLLTSIGLIPENELSTIAGLELDKNTGGPIIDQNLQCTLPGFFSCGNALLVNDLVDDVSKQGGLAGRNAARSVKVSLDVKEHSKITINLGRNINSIVPQELALTETSKDTKFEPIDIYIRVKEPEYDINITVQSNNEIIIHKKLDWIGPGEMVKIKLKQKELEKINELQNDIIIETNPINNTGG